MRWTCVLTYVSGGAARKAFALTGGAQVVIPYLPKRRKLWQRRHRNR